MSRKFFSNNFADYFLSLHIYTVHGQGPHQGPVTFPFDCEFMDIQTEVNQSYELNGEYDLECVYVREYYAII